MLGQAPGEPPERGEARGSEAAVTAAQIVAWARARDWPAHIALEWRPETPLDRHPMVWAECDGLANPRQAFLELLVSGARATAAPPRGPDR
jgi:hypothetical protein